MTTHESGRARIWAFNLVGLLTFAGGGVLLAGAQSAQFYPGCAASYPVVGGWVRPQDATDIGSTVPPEEGEDLSDLGEGVDIPESELNPADPCQKNKCPCTRAGRSVACGKCPTVTSGGTTYNCECGRDVGNCPAAGSTCQDVPTGLNAICVDSTALTWPTALATTLLMLLALHRKISSAV